MPILHCRNAVLNLSVSSISAVVDRAWFTPVCRNFSTFPVAICPRMTLALAPVAAGYGDAALPALRFISSTSWATSGARFVVGAVPNPEE